MKFTNVGQYDWQIENLNVTEFQNGDPINKANDLNEWVDACNCNIPTYLNPEIAGIEFSNMGYLYNWSVINDTRFLVPEYHYIPSIPTIAHLNSSLDYDKDILATLSSLLSWTGYNRSQDEKKSDLSFAPGLYLNKNVSFVLNETVQAYWLEERQPSYVAHIYYTSPSDNGTDNTYELSIQEIENERYVGLPIRCIRVNPKCLTKYNNSLDA